MKNSTRTLTLVFCLFASAFAFAGQPKVHTSPQTSAQGINPGQTNSPNSILPFYSEDFASGLPATWMAIDGNNDSINWKYTTSGAHDGSALSTSGTSAANGYMIYDSDSAQSNNNEMADLVSGRIDCSTHSNVHLNFNEYLVHYNDTAIVYVSTDSVNWTEVHNTSASLSMFQATANPNNVEIDISSIAANQDSVYIRFSYRAQYSYYWMIDDVMLHEVAQMDAALTSITDPSSSCAMLGTNELVSITVYNSGGATINSCVVTYIVDGGAPMSDTINAAITVGSTYPYTFTSNADVSLPGTHTIQAYVTLTGDTNATNDTAISTFFNGPHTVDATTRYQNGFEASDDLSTTLFTDGNQDSITWVLSSSNPFAGNMCALLNAPIADDWVFTTCLNLDSGVAYGLSFLSHLISSARQANLQIAIGQTQDPSGMGQLIQVNTAVVNVNWSQSHYIFTIPSSGTYYIGFEVSNADSAVGFALDNINVEVENGTGITENSPSAVSVYPNPSTGNLFINSGFDSKDGFVVEVINSLGELVKSTTVQTLSNYQVDMSNYNSGMYVVRVISDKGISSHKVTLSN